MKQLKNIVLQHENAKPFSNRPPLLPYFCTFQIAQFSPLHPRNPRVSSIIERLPADNLLNVQPPPLFKNANVGSKHGLNRSNTFRTSVTKRVALDYSIFRQRNRRVIYISFFDNFLLRYAMVWFKGEGEKRRKNLPMVWVESCSGNAFKYISAR